MSPSITNTMRRFSRSSSNRNSANLTQGSQQPTNTNTTGTYTPPLSQQGQGIGRTSTSNDPTHHHQQQHNSRPVSSDSSTSFEHMNRPVSQQYNQGPSSAHQSHLPGANTSTGGMNALPGGHQSLPHSAIGGLSRTDQVVLRYFWEEKYLDNAKRDLHFLKFPFFPQYPGHTDLMPYCEIYHLVKTTPGANIISLGSANGVYIGFELAQGAQLHIDMDDEWRDISHHRVIFKPYESMLRDPTSDTTFKSWPKPLTIEYLEEQYRSWMRDLTSFCWIDEAVRELGEPGAPGQGGFGGVGGSPVHGGIGGGGHQQGLSSHGTGTGTGLGGVGTGTGVGGNGGGRIGHGGGVGLEGKGSRGEL